MHPYHHAMTYGTKVFTSASNCILENIPETSIQEPLRVFSVVITLRDLSCASEVTFSSS